MINTVRLAANGGYIVDGAMHVPNVPGNRHYEEVQEWIEDGGVPEPEVVVLPDYRERRRREYPPLDDQLDVVWKQFNQMRLNGVDLIQEADDMLGGILAVKARHPKGG